MNPSYIEIEGRTVEMAIKVALKKLNLSRSQVEIEILAEGEKGLFGMPGGKLAKVRITPKKVP
jgi:spoIIIJ-associated protein